MILTLWLQGTRYLVLPSLNILPKTRYLVSINSFVCLLRKNYIYVSHMPRNKFSFGVSIESGLFSYLMISGKIKDLYFFPKFLFKKRNKQRIIDTLSFRFCVQKVDYMEQDFSLLAKNNNFMNVSSLARKHISLQTRHPVFGKID